MKPAPGVFDEGAGTEPDEEDYASDSDDSGLPPDFESAYAEYEANPSAQSFWDAVEACTANKGGGVAALLVGPKAKKS